MADVKPLLQKKASISAEDIGKVRFCEAHSGKIHKLLAPDLPVSNLNEFCQIYAEVTPAEELSLPLDDATHRLVSCFHYEKDPSKTHNVPFAFLLVAGEIFSATKERLSKRTGIKGKAFEKIKFAIIRGGQAYARPVYIEDEDVLSDKMALDDQLGLEHANKTRSAWAIHERLNIR